jgi:hypothetical protein
VVDAVQAGPFPFHKYGFTAQGSPLLPLAAPGTTRAYALA